MVQASLPVDLIAYQYNIKGEVIAASNNVSSISYQRDTKGRTLYSSAGGLGSMADYPALEINQDFDNVGRRLSMESSLGTVNYGYDSAYRLTTIGHSNGNNFIFNYDSANRLTAIQRPGSRTDISYYTASGALYQILHSSGGQTLSAWTYQYDARNFPIKKSGLPGDINYTYDNNGQLRGVAGLQSENFDYDAIGNRILDQNGNFVYDQNSQQLTEDWQYFYSYDHNGNLIKKIPKDQSKSAYNYSYNSKNQLTRIEITSTALGPVIKEISYSYDVLGRRMEKRINDLVDSSKTYARRFVYDGDNILGEYSQSGALLASYIHSSLMADDVLEVTYTPEAVQAGITDTYGYFYYLKDHLGTVTEIADTSGHVVQRYNYSAFGKILDIKDATGTDISANPRIRGSFTFTGREWDEESGLYFYRARMYDASIGRFFQSDPAPGTISDPTTSINKYIYTNNGPGIFRDSRGKSILSDIGNEVGNMVKNIGDAAFGFAKYWWDNLIDTNLGLILVEIAVFISSPGVWVAANVTAYVDATSNGTFDDKKFRRSFYLSATVGFAMNGIGEWITSGSSYADLFYNTSLGSITSTSMFLSVAGIAYAKNIFAVVGGHMVGEFYKHNESMLMYWIAAVGVGL